MTARPRRPTLAPRSVVGALATAVIALIAVIAVIAAGAGPGAAGPAAIDRDTVGAVDAAPARYVAVAPARLLDTRTASAA